MANQQSEVRVSDIHNTQDRPAGVVTPQKMERKGRELGRTLKLSLEPPFIHKVVPDPPVDSRVMPGPIAEVYQLCVRKTGDIERDYYQEDERLRQDVAADAQIIERAAGLDLPAPSQRMRTLFYAPLMVAFGVAEACVNVVIFLVLAMSTTSTYLASLMLAVGLPVLAHFAGKSWKQINQKKQNRLVMWITVGAAVVVITAIAIVRCAYVSVTLQSLLGVHLSPITVALVFWGMNLAIFAAATVASHAHTVEDPEGEELGLKVVEAEERLVRNKERLKTLRHEFRTRCEQCDADFKALAAAFFHGNMRARRRFDPKPPVWMLYLPSVPIPVALRRNPDAAQRSSAARVSAVPRLALPNPEDSISTTWSFGGNGRPCDDH